MFSFRRLTGSAIVALFGILPIRADDLIPVETFFRQFELTSARLSPDGTHLAMLAPWDGTQNVAVINLETGSPRFLTDEYLDLQAESLAWLSNDRILYRFGDGSTSSMDQEYWGVIGAVSIHGGRGEEILPDHDFVAVYPAEEDWVLAQRIHSTSVTSGDTILTSYHWGDYEYVNINTNATRSLGRMPINPDAIWLNRHGEPGLAAENNLLSVELAFREHDSRAWTKLRGLSVRTEIVHTPIRFGEEEEDFDVDRYFSMINWYTEALMGDEILASAQIDGDRLSLHRIEIDGMEFDQTPLVADDTYDVQGHVLRHIRSGRVVGYRYEASKPEVVYWEENHARLQAMIEEAIPGRASYISDVDESGQKAVIYSISDRHAPEYFLLNLRTLALESLGNPAPWLAGADLVPQLAIQFTARDGLELHGYLWLPRHWEEGQPVPLILNPHGGPWSRDLWGIRSYLNLEPQFYVSRGFAVLQVNFRGSTGLGQELEDAHIRNLEGMHNDLIDAVHWAIDEGYADPEIIGVAGASWGGYATMMALVKEPDLFAFGINFFGVVDLAEHMRWYREFGREDAYFSWAASFGDPDDDKSLDYLNEWSPLTHIEHLQAPVFVYHGTDDANVDFDQSHDLVRALRRHDKDYERVFTTTEAHGAGDEDDRIDLWEDVDDFLRPWVRLPD